MIKFYNYKKIHKNKMLDQIDETNKIEFEMPDHIVKSKIGVLGGSFDPPTISHLQLCSEALNVLNFDEIWMIPCGSRRDKKNKVSP